MTYKERIQHMSKIHADRYNKGGRREYAGGPLLKNDPEHMEDEAEVTVEAQAEAIREFLLNVFHVSETTESYLIANGYTPAPKGKAPSEEECIAGYNSVREHIRNGTIHVGMPCDSCGVKLTTDDTGTYCDNHNCKAFWDTKSFPHESNTL